MKKMIVWFNQQKLNIKFTIVIGIIVFIPVTTIFFLMFKNIKENEITEMLYNTSYSMNQTYGEVQKTVDLCNMSTQFLLSNANLIQFLIKLKDDVPLNTNEIIDFKRNDIGMVERVVNSNPYLYQIRVYADNNDFPEMMPILYKRERMNMLPWSGNYVSGDWELDYKDVIFPETVMRSAEHMMSLITAIEDFDRGEIGVIEVAVRMDNIFPSLFHADGTRWGCIIDDSGEILTNNGEKQFSKWDLVSSDIIKMVHTGDEEEKYLHTIVAGENVVLAYLPVKELSGYFIQLISMEERLLEITRERNIYLAGLFCAFVLLIVLINGIVNALLTHFYHILSAIRQVQKGDLDVVIEGNQSDEMGELGAQINKMLERIKKLLDENIKRELLMKDSEIRALQNQINAHFIYNVLESIKMMAEIDEKYEISDAVTALGKLLRYSMKWVSNNVTVTQEIDYIKYYLDLINLRFDYTISLALNIPEELYSQEIPKMSLQPIIENAIYHGIEELAEDASIYMKAFVEGDDFTIEITDSGKGMTEDEVMKLQKKISGEIETSGGSGNGIGLKNVQDRIQIAFGGEYGIQIASRKDCYTKVMIKIPITH